MSKLGKFLYKDDDISSKIGIGIIATDNPTSIPRELNNEVVTMFLIVSYPMIANMILQITIHM